MAQVSLDSPRYLVNRVAIQGDVKVNETKNYAYALVMYGFIDLNNVLRPVEMLIYPESVAEELRNTHQPEERYSVKLTGADYTQYQTYRSQGKAPDTALLQILIDKGVIIGKII